MYRLICDISIEKWRFDKINGCEIELDSETLTDTCRITLPQKTVWEGEEGIPIMRGDKITVRLGYDDKANLALRFEGYVTKVNTKSPVVLECEDMMWKLKQCKVEKKSWANVTLPVLLREILPAGTVLMCHSELSLGKYHIRQETAAGVLDDLRRFGVRAYMKTENGQTVLHAGTETEKGQQRKWLFKEGMNIIENNTQLQQSGKVKVEVTAVSTGADGERIEYVTGDKDGEKKSIQRSNVTPEELRKIAENELERYKYDSLKGSFKTFGVPEIDKGDVISLECDKIEKGNYLVKRVSVSFGQGGYKQVIELDKKV